MAYTYMVEGEVARYSNWNLLVAQIVENLNILEFKLGMELTKLWPLEAGAARCWAWKTLNGWQFVDRIDAVRLAIGFAGFTWPAGFNLTDESRFMSAADLATLARAVGYRINPNTTYTKTTLYHDTTNSIEAVYSYSQRYVNVDSRHSVVYCETPELTSSERVHPDRDRYSWSYALAPGYTYYGLLASSSCIANFQDTGPMHSGLKTCDGQYDADINGEQRGLVYIYNVSDAIFSVNEPEIWINGRIGENPTQTQRHRDRNDVFYQVSANPEYYWVNGFDLNDSISTLNFPQIKITERSASPAGQSGAGDSDDGSLSIIDTISVDAGKFDVIFDKPSNDTFYIGVEFSDDLIFNLISDLSLEKPDDFYRTYWSNEGSTYTNYNKHDEISRNLNVSLSSSLTWIACKK